MNEKSLPTLFISHGAPTLPMEDVPAKEFLSELSQRFHEEKSILCISAHWATTRAAVNAVEKPQTIHDFYGFPPELYRIEYSAHGLPELARRVAGLLEADGMSCDIDGERGLDHGAWVPMLLMYPEADVSVVQLSIQTNLDPTLHFALGKAIATLRHEGVLVIGSGGAVHPLGYVPLGPGMATDSWAIEFNDWLTKAVERGDGESLIGYRKTAPYAETAHHYPDHYMPLLVALGAAGPGARGKVIHHSWYWGDLGMDAFEFSAPE